MTERVVALLNGALRRMHALEPADCPFGTPGPGLVVTHGDACLPNFLCEGMRATGYVDLADLALGPPERDLAAALFSLQYNVGPGFGRKLCEAFGWGYLTDSEIEALRRSY